MKEIIACLMFLIAGIFAESKTCKIEVLLVLLLILFIDSYLKLNRDFDVNGKVKFKNFDLLKKSLLISFNYKRLMLLLIFFAYGFISSYFVNNHNNKKALDILYKTNEFEGVALDVTEKENSYQVVIYIKSIKEKVQIYLDKKEYERVLPGYKFTIKGIITNIDSKRNYGSYDEKQNKKQNRIFYNFSGSILKVEKGKIFLITNIYKLKFKICDFYDKILPNKNSGLIKAMIVGESSLIDNDVKELYKKGGVFHILAISGMHIGILVNFIKKLLKKMHMNKTLKTVFLVSILLLYVILTGASISTLRAALMIVFSECAILFNRNYNSTNGLCLAAIVLLIINPMNLFNLSFILSFSAIVAMKFKLNIKGIFENLSGNISIFILMTPIIIFYFYDFQGLSIIANIFILPLTSTLVLSSFACIGFSFINNNVAVMIGKLINLILTYYESVLTYLSQLKFYDNLIGNISIFQLILWYVSYYFIYKFLKTNSYLVGEKRKRIIYINGFIITICILLLTIFFKPKNILVTFVDVDHGDSCIIYDSKENETMIIDGGGTNNNQKDKGYYTVYPYLKYLGINKIDMAVVTHQDRDHIKGIIELTDLLQVDKVALPYGILDGDLYNELISKCTDKNIDIIRLQYGDMFSIGRCKCEVIYPYKNIDEYKFEANNYSIVMNVKIKDKNLLFTGDIEKEAEELILNNELLYGNYYIAKLPHHGSNTSSTDIFASIINPRYGIISGNKTNVTNFNKNNVFKYKNSVIVDTYYNGMITFEMKG